MTRILGPEAGDRLCYVPGSTLGGTVGRYVTIYAAASGGTLADILTYDGTQTPGAAITNSQLTVDADSLLPLFWFPDNTDTVYADGGEAARVPIRAKSLTTMGGTLAGGVALTSTNAGGGNTSDSTSRIQLSTYQRAVNPNHFGEAVRVDLKANDAKGMIAWREDYTGSGPRSVAWIGAHGLSNDGLSWHNHISIEVPDLTGALQTALEIPYATWNVANGFGISASDVYVRSVAKFVVGAGVPLIIEGLNTANRDMHFATADGTNIGGKDSYRRWTVRADSTAESGSSVGSDFQIIRRDDTGASPTTALFIKRDTGFVGLGGNTSPAALLDIGAGTGTVGAVVRRGSTSNFGSYILSTGATDRWALQMVNDSTEDLRLTNSAQGNVALLVENRATAPNISLLTSTKSYGGGVGVVFVANASTGPSTNPTGGVVLYVSSGRLKIRQPDGTDQFVALTAS